jgi:Uma2 family endonuclease
MIRTRELYWQAGIAEYWLVDARGETLEFTIFQRGPRGYVATRRQGGWLKSKVLGKSFRLIRHIDALEHPEFTLEVK